MTKTEFVRMLCRAFAVYLAIWAISDCTYLPHYLHSLFHYMDQRSVVAVRRDYWADYYLIETAAMLMRVVLLGVAALYFWQGGRGVSRLFLGAGSSAEGQEGPV